MEVNVSSQSPDQTLVCLKKNVLYVTLAETGEPIKGKVISINDKKSYKPNSDTAALLLYLLVCDDDDPILLSDLMALAKAKFAGATDAGILAFLDKLNANYKILKIRSGGSGTTDPDPFQMFGAPQIPWQNPDLTLCDAPICKANTFYSTGYGPVIIPR